MADPPQSGPAGWSANPPSGPDTNTPPQQGGGPAGWTSAQPNPLLKALAPPGTTMQQFLTEGASAAQGVLDTPEGLIELPSDLSKSVGGPGYPRIPRLPGATDPVAEAVGQALPWLFGGEVASGIRKGAEYLPKVLRAAPRVAADVSEWFSKPGGIAKSAVVGGTPGFVAPGTMEERGSRAATGMAGGAALGAIGDIGHWFGPQLNEEFMQQRLAQLYKQIGEPQLAPSRLSLSGKGLTSQPSRAGALQKAQTDIMDAMSKADFQLGLDYNMLTRPPRNATQAQNSASYAFRQAMGDLAADNQSLANTSYGGNPLRTPFAYELDRYVSRSLGATGGRWNGAEFRDALRSLRLQQERYARNPSTESQSTAAMLGKLQKTLRDFATGSPEALAQSRNTRSAYAQWARLNDASGGGLQESLATPRRLLNEMSRHFGNRWARWTSPDRTFAEQAAKRSPHPPVVVRALVHGLRHKGMPVPFVHGDTPFSVGPVGRAVTEATHAAPRLSPLGRPLTRMLTGSDDDGGQQ
jgi:hypothetical protein